MFSSILHTGQNFVLALGMTGHGRDPKLWRNGMFISIHHSRGDIPPTFTNFVWGKLSLVKSRNKIPCIGPKGCSAGGQARNPTTSSRLGTPQITNLKLVVCHSGLLSLLLFSFFSLQLMNLGFLLIKLHLDVSLELLDTCQ